MLKTYKNSIIVGILLCLATSNAYSQESTVGEDEPVDVVEIDDDTVEVLHFWTSGGEGAAIDVLKGQLADSGIRWTDMIVSGGGGAQARDVLESRVRAQNPPTAAQIQGFDIIDWASRDVQLGNLNAVAAAQNWDNVVPAAIQQFSKSDGQWIAAPVNVHSTNWLWINKELLDATGLQAPQTWDELVNVLEKMRLNGVPAPLSHGGQDWQVATMFDGVALSLGAEFYQSALIELDPQALLSSRMEEAFARMQTLAGYTDSNTTGRFWNLASAMVIEGFAGMQVMGDWAKGEFLQSGKVPGEDFVCIRFPGTQGSVTFNSDQFVMFNVAENRRNAQLQMASAVMSPRFQSSFNVVKGSVPARVDVSDADFDDCGKKAIKDLAQANQNSTLFGSFSQSHAVPPQIRQAMVRVIAKHFDGDYTNKQAVEEMAAIVGNLR